VEIVIDERGRGDGLVHEEVRPRAISAPGSGKFTDKSSVLSAGSMKCYLMMALSSSPRTTQEHNESPESVPASSAHLKKKTRPSSTERHGHLETESPS
jgi:hypothetical protein